MAMNRAVCLQASISLMFHGADCRYRKRHLTHRIIPETSQTMAYTKRRLRPLAYIKNERPTARMITLAATIFEACVGIRGPNRNFALGRTIPGYSTHLSTILATEEYSSGPFGVVCVIRAWLLIYIYTKYPRDEFFLLPSPANNGPIYPVHEPMETMAGLSH